MVVSDLPGHSLKAFVTTVTALRFLEFLSYPSVHVCCPLFIIIPQSCSKFQSTFQKWLSIPELSLLLALSPQAVFLALSQTLSFLAEIQT